MGGVGRNCENKMLFFIKFMLEWDKLQTVIVHDPILHGKVTVLKQDVAFVCVCVCYLGYFRGQSSD